jgi:acetoin utilization protein AcuB
MDKIMVSELMVRYPLTVTPDTTIEEAALYLKEHGFSSVPVVEGEKLVGFLTVAEIFDCLIKLLGYGEKGSRLAIETGDRVDLIADVAQVIRDFDIFIKGAVYYVKDNGNVEIKLRLDTKDTASLIEVMEEQGLKVSQIS